MASPTLSPIPEIHLLLISPTAVTAFAEAKKKHLDPLALPTSTLQFHIHEASLSQLDETIKFDLIVSPANVPSLPPLSIPESRTDKTARATASSTAASTTPSPAPSAPAPTTSP